MYRPSLRQLEYVVALDDERSFQNAADACFVTQPALSSQLRVLEEQLGMRLFERSPRGVVPTPAGLEVARRAREVLGGVDDLVAAARGAAEPLSGPLRLGVIPTIAPFLLPTRLPRIRRNHSKLRLLLVEDQTAHLVEATREGRLDVSLLALEADLGDLETLPLFRDHFLVAVPKAHPLAVERPVSERELGACDVLLLEDGHCFRDQALEVCHRAGATEAGDFRASSLGTLLEVAAGGMGIALLPEMAATGRSRVPSELVLRRFRKPEPFRTIGFAWRRTSPRAAEFRQLGELLRPS